MSSEVSARPRLSVLFQALMNYAITIVYQWNSSSTTKVSALPSVVDNLERNASSKDAAVRIWAGRFLREKRRVAKIIAVLIAYRAG